MKQKNVKKSCGTKQQESMTMKVTTIKKNRKTNKLRKREK